MNAVDARPRTHTAGKRHACFLSYKTGPSHADPTRNGDSAVAKALRAQLHQIGRPFWKLRALHVFHDESNLAPGLDLPKRIADAVDDSEFFVLLASPQSAASSWVRAEVKRWLANDPRAERLIIAVSGGKLVWQDAGYDPVDTTALPPELVACFTSEPHWVDLRPFRSDDDLRSAEFRKVGVAISARIQGRTPDEIDGEDRRRRQQLNTVLTSALLISVSAALYALQQRDVALDQAAHARSSQLASEARVALQRTPAEAPPGISEAYALLDRRGLSPSADLMLAANETLHQVRDVVHWSSEVGSTRALLQLDPQTLWNL